MEAEFGSELELDCFDEASPATLLDAVLVAKLLICWCFAFYLLTILLFINHYFCSLYI